MEGELKDVPILTKDDDWKQKKRISKKNEDVQEKKKSEGNNLFETFKLRGILAEIEKAEA